MLFLPGLAGVVEAEVRDRLGFRGPVTPVPGRDDSLSLDYPGSWRRLLTLRTVVAVFAVLSFPVPRPRSLTSGEYFPEIVRTVNVVRELDGARPPASFRFDAAGHTSPVFRRLAGQLADETGLRYEPDDGDVVLRFRRGAASVAGWDVLVRISTRPLSYRPWRVRDFAGAVNATIAASVTRLTGHRPTDRVANLLCGSGTLLIERLLAGPARVAVGVDNDPTVLEACVENLAAAGLEDRVTLVAQDIGDPGWTAYGPFDLLLADPPWGGVLGRHSTNDALYRSLLESAHAAAAPGARFAVLTHEIKLMQRCLDEYRHLWRQEQALRVFQKGPQPRIFVLRRGD